MWILLPAMSFVFCSLFYRIKLSFLGWRGACLASAVTVASLAIIFLEIASFFTSVNVLFVRSFWVVLTIGTMGAAWGCCQKRHGSLLFSLRMGVFEWICLVFIGIILVVNACVAFVAPPNNWDSMTYHLPRVMHWAANSSLCFYPTHIGRQLVFPPGAEFLLLHVYLLWGDDRWFNLLQWGCLSGCLVSVSLIAKLLGANVRGQVLATLLMVTLPMAVLQSTSTQNDLVVGFWMSASVALGFILYERFSRTVFLLVCAAAGLSILTKGTFFVAVPLMIWFVVSLWGKLARYFMAGLIIVLILVGGHYFRSWKGHDGSHLFNSKQTALLMKQHDLPSIAANAVCQVGAELMVPVDSINYFLVKTIVEGTGLMGVDVTKTDGSGFSFFSAPRPLKFVFDEDYASNPLHMVLILLVPFFLWISRSKKKVWLYFVFVMAGCLLFFCVVRSQDWITRFHLPLFILFVPVVGLVICCRKWLAVTVGVFLVAGAFLVISSHPTRPLFGRNHLGKYNRDVYYFMKKPRQMNAFMSAASVINVSGCRDVGLVEGEDSWEYPLWALTGYGRVKYRSMGIVPWEEQPPCLVLMLDQPGAGRYEVAGEIFNKTWEEGPIQIFSSRK